MSQMMDGHIEITPGVVGGKPRVAGRRITVQNIAVWHERLGMTPDEIATEYDLTLAYYFDHRESINQAIRDDETFVKEMRKASPSLLRKKFAEILEWPETS
jgi:uncharacterized protein (DUF433 family)